MSAVRLFAPLALGTALAFASPVLAQDAPPPPAPPPARVSVSGEGLARGAPDLAVTQLTVMRSAATAADALGQVNTAMDAVRGAMPSFGVEARDLQTSGFQISPQYRYDNRSDGTQAPPVLTGYEVRNTLSVKVRDLAKLGELLDRAVQLGVNEGGSISFQIEDDAALRDAARRDAVARARSSATVLAEAAGLKLGRVVTIEDTASGFVPLPPPMPMGEMRMMANSSAKVPVEAGENTISAQVRIVYELQP
ncbi:SIMPL domain-containing protein [Aureimonas sp. Leaf324]|uniref:SIMPL domain-containing protein n=1 Tax=Aureimonas sp. Leaf324 TaxID=1736336 RepID=UPI000AAD5C48|nr:SIMPL domain-containing protein [Aureimonas sp. Leaf324]